MQRGPLPHRPGDAAGRRERVVDRERGNRLPGAVQLLRRHVLLFVAMAQPEVELIARARPKNVEQMFRSAAAQEMAGRRELLLARLHEQGALTLDLNPQALTSSVLNQYLTVKERAMV